MLAIVFGVTSATLLSLFITFTLRTIMRNRKKGIMQKSSTKREKESEENGMHKDEIEIEANKVGTVTVDGGCEDSEAIIDDIYDNKDLIMRSIVGQDGQDISSDPVKKESVKKPVKIKGEPGENEEPNYGYEEEEWEPTSGDEINFSHGEDDYMNKLVGIEDQTYENEERPIREDGEIGATRSRVGEDDYMDMNQSRKFRYHRGRKWSAPN
jgi:hypothetical protein